MTADGHVNRSIVEALRQLRELRNQFNLFQTLGSFGLESTHEKMLSWLMNPRENHGLGTRFLHSFVSSHGAPVSEFPTTTVVRTQRKIGAGRLDIIARSETAALIVELKTYAPAHNPFDDYRAWAVSRFGDRSVWCVYLTPEGKRCGSAGWLTMRYAELQGLVDDALLEANVHPDARPFIEQYSRWMDRHFFRKSDANAVAREISAKWGAELDSVGEEWATEVDAIRRLARTDRQEMKRCLAEALMELPEGFINRRGDTFSPSDWPQSSNSLTPQWLRASVSEPNEAIEIKFMRRTPSEREGLMGTFTVLKASEVEQAFNAGSYSSTFNAAWRQALAECAKLPILS